MPRTKRSSRTLERAEQRYASLQSIDEQLNLGEGLTLGTYKQQIEDLRNQINAYNTILSSADRAANLVKTLEIQVNTLSERMLLGVATRYGKDSNEYEMAGGTRKSERKRPARKESVV
ncbi:MAG: hypothetical protein ACFE0J_17440 [Elainellaceae cyanobacterium]